MNWAFNEAFIASLPLLGLIAMLVVLRWPILRSAIIALLCILLIAITVFSLDFLTAIGSFSKAALITIDIAIILIGAIVFFRAMKITGILDALQQKLLLLTPDHRLQAILIAWLLGGFIEGVAGFGTPALVVAPLLISIGFSPLKSVLLALIANSTAVTFGAVGTPIRVGFTGIDIQGVAGTASSINLIAGPVIPLMMLLVIVTSKKERWWRSFIECVPWTLWAGFSFTVPMWLFVKVGQEFGTLLGALSGIIITGVSIKLHFLTPKNIWQIKAPVSATNDSATAPVRLFYLPYLILVILLLAAKFILKNAEWNIYLPGNIIYGAKLFNPGWLFLLTLLVLGMSQRNILKVLSTAFFESIPKAARSLKVIFIITSFVQVFISTGMLNSIAANIQPGILSFLTPFLGAFGSFLTGSATVSNMLIAPVISSIEVMNLKFLLALQLLGAAAGNMIALQNILTITAAIDSKEREGKLLLYLITLCLLYLSLILVVACLLPL